jgi:ABC-2 type transport system permease protein
MFTIFKREVNAYFYSPIAYVIIGLFTLLASLFFSGTLVSGTAEFNSTLSALGIVLVFIIPILTMRILAEDKKNGTDVLLITSPVSITATVVGKYLAAVLVFGVMTVITFIYPLILFIVGSPALPQLVGGYVGFFLLGSTFIAIGVFASSLTENQVIAAVIGFVSLLLMWFIDFLAGTFLTGIASQILSWFSLLSRYKDFNSGIFDLAPVVYYLSFIVVFLFLTIRVVEKRRWSQG